MTEPSHAVFLSYASQDAEAAQKICEALRAADIEVWFDQSELRGGDAWDQSIRRQIKTCALFIPVVSRHTHDRAEGYFRLEWKLAVDRSHLIMANKAFLLPVVVDDTRDDDENVPDQFRDVQWTRLPGGETPTAFVERVQRLLSGEESTPIRAGAASGAAGTIGGRSPAPGWSKRILPLAAAVVVLIAVAYLAINRTRMSKQPAASSTTARAASSAFAPPPHSVAVLPFVNMSGDKEQEYFSDGLTEELLNSLSRINELQVAARTSSFSFQGEHPDIATVAHKLNVASVLEGSVRRSGRTIRVTAQLNSALTGFHLWSQTYDRDLGDVLKLQTDIANAVASALKVTLLGNVAAKIELGGTRNPAAFDAYLRASRLYSGPEAGAEENLKAATAQYTEALRHDPNYALAAAGRSITLEYTAEWELGKPPHDGLLRGAESDARRAITLAPDMGEGHLALAYVFEARLELTRAMDEYARALSLAPGNARVARNYGIFAVDMGHTDAGLAAARHAVVIDPLNPKSHIALALATLNARLYEESLKATQDAALLGADHTDLLLGVTYYMLGEVEKARALCEPQTGSFGGYREFCLAVVYDKLGRHVDAEAMLAKAQKERSDGEPVQYAAIYAQWGVTRKALDWLETAARLRDVRLESIRVDPLLDPLRKEPRFQAIEQELRFPD